METLLLLPVYLTIFGFGLGSIDFGNTICKHSTFSYAHLSLAGDGQGKNALNLAGRYVFGGRENKDVTSSSWIPISRGSTWMMGNEITSRVKSTEETVVSRLLNFGGKQPVERNSMTITSSTLTCFGRLTAATRACAFPERVGTVPVDKGKIPEKNPYNFQEIGQNPYQMQAIKSKEEVFPLYSYWQAGVLQGDENCAIALTIAETQYVDYVSGVNANNEAYDAWERKAKNQEAENEAYKRWEEEHKKKQAVGELYDVTLDEFENNPYEYQEIDQNPYAYQELSQNPYKYEEVGRNPYTYQEIGQNPRVKQTLMSQENYRAQQGYQSYVNLRAVATVQGNWNVVTNCNLAMLNIDNNYQKYKSNVEANNAEYQKWENNAENQRQQNQLYSEWNSSAAQQRVENQNYEDWINNAKTNNALYSKWENWAQTTSEENNRYSQWRQNYNTIEMVTQMRISVPAPDLMMSKPYNSAVSQGVNLKLFH